MPKAEWTHEAHLRVGLWHLLRYPEGEALRRLRDGIRRYNTACGVAKTEASGYHETITRFCVRVIGRFLIYYRDNAKWLERTYDFVPRIGLEKLKKVLLDDELGLAGYFDREVEATIAAYVDPWLEREKPVYAGQFEDTKAIALPMLT